MSKICKIAQIWAPGKLIISGEYSVLYSQPAIATAVNYYNITKVSVSPSDDFTLDFTDLKYKSVITKSDLERIHRRLTKNYHNFLENHCLVQDILAESVELLIFVLAEFFINNNFPKSGLLISVNSSIPINCGMGSSAAAILSLLYALHLYYGINLNDDKFFSLCKKAENMRHGKSSGLDLCVSMYGGLHKFHNDKNIIQNVTIPQMYIVNTGVPRSSTGECVIHAKEHFADKYLAQSFGMVTDSIFNYIQDNNYQELILGIKENHQLLKRVGVIPDKVLHFISEIESAGGAGKICGAGSIKGDNAGVVLLLGDKKKLERVALKYGFFLESFNIDYQGVRCV